MKEIVRSLQVITIGNNTYIGAIKGNKILHAITYETVSSKGYNIRHWFERYNVNELAVISISTNSEYSTRPFDRNEQLTVDRCMALLERIKKFSLQYLENDLFDRYYKSEGS